MNEQYPSCEACKEIHSKKNPPEEPPCGDCRPTLLPENKQIVDVYLLTRNQFITVGMGQIADIDIKAVKIVMDLLEIKDQKDCLEKVRQLFQRFKPE